MTACRAKGSKVMMLPDQAFEIDMHWQLIIVTLEPVHKYPIIHASLEVFEH